MALYEHLIQASPAERQATARRLISDMRGVDPAANRAYWQLCDKVIGHRNRGKPESQKELPPWEFSAANSALLVLSVPRVNGFLRAIDRAPQAGKIIDAGCGSSAILAIGAAASHPESTIFAYDINKQAVECARDIIELFGLEQRIEVGVKDATTDDLPEVDLAVTETFHMGLFTERGPQITAALGKVSAEVLPALGRIRAADEPIDAAAIFANTVLWQEAAEIDLTVPNSMVQGSLVSTGAGIRPINVYAGYYDARGDTIIDRRGADCLTKHVQIGEVFTPESGLSIDFSYQLGYQPHESEINFTVHE